jgi:hypothetical protein
LPKSNSQRDQVLYIYRTVPHWNNFFGDIIDYQDFVKTKLFNELNENIVKQIPTIAHPEIGIHVRLGDLRKLLPHEDFAKVGGVRTPIHWYCNVLNQIRDTVGYAVPATVFSDGDDDECIELLKLPNVQRAEANTAISDIITLSKSKILITSAGSTFSGWAAYLGQCPTIWHPDHFHAGLFPDSIKSAIFEGGFDPENMPIPPLLKSNLISIFSERQE